MNNDTVSVYFDAAHYAVDVLCDDAPKCFDRLHQLAQVNELDELKAIIDGWARGLKPPARPIKAGLWKVGSVWGESTRIEHDRGVVWKLRCSCGEFFAASTNDTIPADKRKCPSCQLADELSEANQELVEQLRSTAQLVLEWHKAHDKVVWIKVHDACRRRNIQDDNFKQELHALCWAKISEKAATYQDRGFKVSAWLSTVAKNALIDHFKKEWRRHQLAPMTPFLEDSGNRGIPNPNPATSEERLPARPVAPKGASPNTKALNPSQTAWDAHQGWDSADRAQDGESAGAG